MLKISIKELAEKSKECSLIAIVGRDDEENTKCAVEFCRCINSKEGQVVYFSLKEEKEDFVPKYPNLQVNVLDTAGIEVEKLIEIIQKKNEISPVRLLVVDYLTLLSYSVKFETRQEEVQYCISQLKRLSVEQNIPILILLLLSKYVAKDTLVMDEMMKYGYMPELIDIITYREKATKEFDVQILKDENSYDN